jgi:hypothetical protein
MFYFFSDKHLGIKNAVFVADFESIEEVALQIINEKIFLGELFCPFFN